jgi:putative chitinase
MALISKQQLAWVFKEADPKRIDRFLPYLNQTLEEFEINTPQRIRMFLAQIGHESGQLRYVRELASGEAYEGRKDLGNTSPGDGVRYKGRGLIQITGKANYVRVSQALGLPLLEKPELLEEDQNAVRSAGWFWYKNNLNSLADMGLFREVTKRINGGYNGYADRYKLYQRALEIIK